MKHKKHAKTIRKQVQTQLRNKAINDYNENPNETTPLNEYFLGNYIPKTWLFKADSK